MPTPPRGKEPFTPWHGLLLAEAAAVAIGLLMPVTPSRTGSGRGIAELLFDQPGYALQVVVYFTMSNLLMAALAVAAWLWWRHRDGGSRR